MSCSKCEEKTYYFIDDKEWCQEHGDEYVYRKQHPPKADKRLTDLEALAAREFTIKQWDYQQLVPYPNNPPWNVKANYGSSANIHSMTYNSMLHMAYPVDDHPKCISCPQCGFDVIEDVPAQMVRCQKCYASWPWMQFFEPEWYAKEWSMNKQPRKHAMQSSIHTSWSITRPSTMTAETYSIAMVNGANRFWRRTA